VNNLERLLTLDLPQAARQMRAGSVSPVDLCEAYLQRIADTEPALNAYVTVDADGARADACRAARELAAGCWRGPLHGVPVGVKDLFDTAGLRTTYGSARYREHVPAVDAELVTRLREAGAVLLGKHATHEFAWGGRTDNPHFGPTRNPHDLARVPGGSSGGGAASVAVRSCLLAIGTDTAGSVRIPAALSGCVGFKPTRGWAPLVGVHPLATSLDHVGLLARSVGAVRLAYASLSAAALAPDGFTDLRDVRVGVLSGQSHAALRPTVRFAVEEARRYVTAAGATVSEVDLPDVAARVVAILTLVRAEAEMVHRGAFLRDPEVYGADLQELLQMGAVDDETARAARAVVDHTVEAVSSALESHDVLLGATVPITAPLIGQLRVELCGEEFPIELLLTRLTSLANAAGIPALSIPGKVGSRLPTGVQVMGRPHGESTVLRVGETVA
jgi:aspartyl-tRNA(Asn)/glutamyl-tRNA(Gln) amidotransferase subunit A